VTGTVLALGVAVIAAMAGLYGLFAGSLGDAGAARTVLLILVLLAPIQALDDVLMSTFAVFSRPRAIFFRKYVLAPGLRLVVILAVIGFGSSVQALAAGYVAAGATGIAVFAWILVRTLRDRGLVVPIAPRAVLLPAREIYGFAFPLLAVDLMAVVMSTSSVVMLAQFGTATDVATYRVVLPAARLNLLVMTSFTLLFTPMAARLFVRADRSGIEELYWRTATWIAVFSFPL